MPDFFTFVHVLICSPVCLDRGCRPGLDRRRAVVVFFIFVDLFYFRLFSFFILVFFVFIFILHKYSFALASSACQVSNALSIIKYIEYTRWIKINSYVGEPKQSKVGEDPWSRKVLQDCMNSMIWCACADRLTVFWVTLLLFCFLCSLLLLFRNIPCSSSIRHGEYEVKVEKIQMKRRKNEEKRLHSNTTTTTANKYKRPTQRACA